ncbi:MAG: trypsin-like peptidase domain-containing protein [Flavobacteriales bacterium]|jgi:hypothetical protein|nr:trypsin-like peptidase domain-containing protein [Flavobacteriales bacterium]
MKHVTLAAGLFAGLLHTTTALGQISFGGTPPSMAKAAHLLDDAPVAVMPAVDADALMAEDEARYATGAKGPYRFGFNHATDLSLANSGTWTELPNGDRVWRLAIECPGAHTINFEFHDYHVPPGAMVHVVNDMGDMLGGFTAESNGGLASMGVDMLPGDRITIEYTEPAAVRGEGRLQVGQVTHGYRDLFKLAKGLGDSGSCNNNVICPEGDPWRDQIRSVAIMMSGGSGFCTGQLINNCAEDGTPYFLTANHCLGGSMNNWVFRFNWESPQCGQNLNGPTNQSVSGATLKASSGGSDVALLELNTTPPAGYNVFYSGWDRSGTASTSNVGIHHPSGDIKKITFDNNPATQASWGGAQCWRVATWEDGTTEPGSSGSGLWNQNGHLIGQLYGGQASCANNVNDYYGRFNVSWTQLSAHLGSCGPTLDGHDPNATEAYAYDAQLQSITNVPASLCDQNTIQPTVTIKNNGTQTLTSLQVGYAVSGGGPSGNATWNGSLASGATANFQLPVLALPNGSLTLTLTASAPNGQPDENPNNNTASTNVLVASPGVPATLQLTTDNWASETTWQVTAQGSGTVLASGGPYSNGTNGQVISEPFCLPADCYTFTIFDEWGDGICCDYGQGNLQIVGGAGQVLGTHNGQFTDAASVDFCLSAVGVDEVAAFPGLHVVPNPTAGAVSVLFGSPLAHASTLTVLDLCGRTVRQLAVPAGAQRAEADLSGQARGTYLLRMANAQGEEVRRVVLMD